MYIRASGTAWKQACAEPIISTSYSVSGLLADMKYSFRVCAVNKAGAGPYSDSSKLVQASQALGKSLVQASQALGKSLVQAFQALGNSLDHFKKCCLFRYTCT